MFQKKYAIIVSFLVQLTILKGLILIWVFDIFCPLKAKYVHVANVPEKHTGYSIPQDSGVKFFIYKINTYEEKQQLLPNITGSLLTF